LEKLLGNFEEHRDDVDISSAPPNNKNKTVVQFDNDSSGNINLETQYKSFLLTIK